MSSLFDLGCTPEDEITNIPLIIAEYEAHKNDGNQGGESGSGQYLWLGGAAAAVVSACSVALGTLIQKLALNKNEELPDDQKARIVGGILLSKLWLCGFLTMIVLQFPLALVAFSLAPQSIIVPLGAGSTIVFDQLFAPCLLGEKLGKREIFATFFIIAGIVITTSSTIGAAHHTLTACQLIGRYKSISFILPSSLYLTTMIILFVIVKYSKYRPRGLNPLIPVFYAVIAACSGSMLDGFLKGVGQVAAASATSTNGSNINPWLTIIPYLQIIGCIVFAVGVISFINQGLALFDAVVFLPLYNCLYIVMASVYGGIVYLEFAVMTPDGLIRFGVGIVICCFGVAMLSLRGHKLETVEDFALSVRQLPLQLASGGDLNLEELPSSVEERRKAFQASTTRGWKQKKIPMVIGGMRGMGHKVYSLPHRVGDAISAGAHAVGVVGHKGVEAVSMVGHVGVSAVGAVGHASAHAVTHLGHKISGRKSVTSLDSSSIIAGSTAAQDDNDENNRKTSFRIPNPSDSNS